MIAGTSRRHVRGIWLGHRQHQRQCRTSKRLSRLPRGGPRGQGNDGRSPRMRDLESADATLANPPNLPRAATLGSPMPHRCRLPRRRCRVEGYYARHPPAELSLASLDGLMNRRVAFLSVRLSRTWCRMPCRSHIVQDDFGARTSAGSSCSQTLMGHCNRETIVFATR